MKPLILSLLLATSLSAKVIEKSCPVCGQCEPKVLTIPNDPNPDVVYLSPSYVLGGGHLWVCGDKDYVFYMHDDTIKWVPKRAGTVYVGAKFNDSLVKITPFGTTTITTKSGKRLILADTMKDRQPTWSPYLDSVNREALKLKRKCVDDIKCDTTSWEVNAAWTKPNIRGRDTTWCDCDGDSAYWRMVVIDSDSARWANTLNGGYYPDISSTPDTIYVRREDRWRKETKTVTTWIKRKPVTETIWK